MSASDSDRPPVTLTEEEQRQLIDYEIYRRTISLAFYARGHGVGQQASRDLNLAATTVSAVLGGKLINRKILEDIDRWIQSAEEPDQSRARR